MAKASEKSGGSVVKLVFRVVLGIVLVVAIIALGLDTLARSQSDAAYEKLGKFWGPGVQDPATPGEVEELLGRAPDQREESPGDEMLQVYTWRGVRSYKVYALYRVSHLWKDDQTKTSIHHLEDVSKNNPPISYGGGGGTPAAGPSAGPSAGVVDPGAPEADQQ